MSQLKMNFRIENYHLPQILIDEYLYIPSEYDLNTKNEFLIGYLFSLMDIFRPI